MDDIKPTTSTDSAGITVSFSAEVSPILRECRILRAALEYIGEHGATLGGEQCAAVAIKALHNSETPDAGNDSEPCPK